MKTKTKNSTPHRERSSPLSDVVVVEFGSRTGVGVCGSILAQLGATVVLVEKHNEAPLRYKWQTRAQFAAGKFSIVAEPTAADDTALLSALVARAEIVLTSSDVDGDIWQKSTEFGSQHSVVCDITAFGRTGPLSGQASSDMQVQALSGIMDTTGRTDGPPTLIPLPLVEFMTGLYAAAAVLAALRVLDKTGDGQEVDMAMFDCAFASMATFLPGILIGHDVAVRRVGNRHPMIAPWNVYQANDGWLILCANSDLQWRRLCKLMNRTELALEFGLMENRVLRVEEVDAAVQDWVGRHTIASALEALRDANISSGPITEIHQYPRDKNIDYRAMVRQLRDPVKSRKISVPGSPLRMSVSPGQAPERLPSPDEDRAFVRQLVGRFYVPARSADRDVAKATLPLAGVRVLEIGHYTTAPLCARHLASLGAEVIKIEPPEGDPVRSFPPIEAGISVYFQYANAGKESFILDLSQPSGAEILRELIAKTDVLVENLKAGALARRGFSWDVMQSINPRLIYCSVSGFGQDSLYSERPAVDSVIQAMSGVMDLVRSNTIPMKSGISFADILGAEMALTAIIAALRFRDRYGKGQHLDLSMQDIAVWATQTLWNGELARPEGELLKCNDGFVFVESSPTPTTGSSSDSSVTEYAVDFETMRRSEVVAWFEVEGIKATAVLTTREVAYHPQTSARRLWFSCDVDGKQWPMLASPIRLLKTPARDAPPMGQLGGDDKRIELDWGLHVGEVSTCL